MSAVLAEQGSAQWLQDRLGCLTGSRFAEAIAKAKSKDEYLKSRYDLQIELLSERLTGVASPHFVSREMLEGLEAEGFAVAAYELENDCECSKIGVFVPHPTIPYFGATLDRSVGAAGLLEVKSPKSLTFVEIVLLRKLGYVNSRFKTDTDDGYIAQAMVQLACCPEREWNDLTYYDPRMPVGQQLYTRRLYRDSDVIKAIEDQARAFLAELDALQKRFV